MNKSNINPSVGISLNTTFPTFFAYSILQCMQSSQQQERIIWRIFVSLKGQNNRSNYYSHESFFFSLATLCTHGTFSQKSQTEIQTNFSSSVRVSKISKNRKRNKYFRYSRRDKWIYKNDRCVLIPKKDKLENRRKKIKEHVSRLALLFEVNQQTLIEIMKSVAQELRRKF